MKVAELAEELGVPTSAVLEQCQRFGIDASWAGAELRGADLVVLRAEMAIGETPLDLRPADAAPVDHDAAWPTSEAVVDPLGTEVHGDAVAPAPGAGPDPADRGSAVVQPLPPTAVGSMPDLIDEVTPDVPPEPVIQGPLRTREDLAHIDDEGVRRIPPRPPAERKAIPRPARNSIFWLAIAIAAFVGSNVTDNPFIVAGLWLVCLLALAVTIYDANRGRRAISTHPDRLKGKWLAIPMMGLGILATAGLLLSVSAAVREQPAADAPLGVGDLSSVQTARWGYQRVTRVASEGWHRPAKDVGTCWDRRGDAVRQEGRVEIGNHLQRCTDAHTVEIVAVFAYDRDADSPFPGEAAIQREVEERCGPILDDVLESGVAEGQPVALFVERPTVAGWDDGDHDIACALVSPSRSDSLVD